MKLKATDEQKRQLIAAQTEVIAAKASGNEARVFNAENKYNRILLEIARTGMES